MSATMGKQRNTLLSKGKSHQGPTFPYRFSLEPSDLRRGEKPVDFHFTETFSRWTVVPEERPRALEWSDHGKGKGATALPSDEPARCCGECTPVLFLTHMATSDGTDDVPTPGAVYRAFIAGNGWYSSPTGTEFLVRLVTNLEEVTLLHQEAAIYEQYESLCSREPFRAKNAVSPLEFHGFFQSESGNAAAVVLKPRLRVDKNARPRRKMGKKMIRRMV